MKLIKNKTYRIVCVGPYDYCKYSGVGIYTGVSDDWLNLGIVYEFDTKDEGKIWISEELDIIIEDKNEDS